MKGERSRPDQVYARKLVLHCWLSEDRSTTWIFRELLVTIATAVHLLRKDVTFQYVLTSGLKGRSCPQLANAKVSK